MPRRERTVARRSMVAAAKSFGGRRADKKDDEGKVGGSEEWKQIAWEFYDLIAECGRRSGVPMLLNTSFNGKDEPIVETPQHALRTMLATGLDACVFSDFVAVPQ